MTTQLPERNKHRRADKTTEKSSENARKEEYDTVVNFFQSYNKIQFGA